MLLHNFQVAESAGTAVADRPIPVDRWSLATRIAFRFSFVYFGLYVVTTQMLTGLLVLPVGYVPNLGRTGAMQALVSWVAAHVFHVTTPLVITGSGSGDKTFDWVQAFCLLVVAVAATAVWSGVRRTAARYVGFHKWFHLFIRFALGSTMVGYGMAKAIPLQMPAPQLTRLLEPYGNFSPMGVLWYSVGASRPYEMFTGCAELAGGILLFFPRTATLGALICLADTMQIFTLNMTYDVPVKLFSFQLILMSLFLLAPEARRLANVLVFNRTAGPSTQPPLGRSPRAIRIGAIAQGVFGIYLVGMGLYGARQSWYSYGGGAPKPPLYGIWNITEMQIDGQTRSPLVTDYDRWRRLVIQSAVGIMLQRMDDTFVGYGAKVDMTAKTIALTKAADKAWNARFTFEQPTRERLVLAGTLDGHSLRMKTELVDHTKFLLVSRGFHWVQEYPFNR